MAKNQLQKGDASTVKDSTPTKDTTTKKSMNKTLKYGLIIGGAVILIGAGIYFYKKHKK